MPKLRKVVDLGIGYDYEFINYEIEQGYYDDALTLAHVNSGIAADYFYGDNQCQDKALIIRNIRAFHPYIPIENFEIIGADCPEIQKALTEDIEPYDRKYGII